MIADGPGPITLPAGLRERVLQASQAVRAAGSAVPAVPTISATQAFSRAADAFHGVLCALDDDDWYRPVLRDLTVQGLVGHLIGVEYDVHRALAGDTAVANVDHVESTQPRADRQTGRAPRATRREWRAATERTTELVAGSDLGAEVAMHTLELSIGALLLVRAFELWTHENDIRRVSGLPPSVPDRSALALMADLAARALPVGGDRVGLRRPTHVRLVLTGAGGGVWEVSLGEAGYADDDAVPVRIVADAVDFCRLAANRATPRELDLHVTGDVDRATEVLAAVAALALD